MAAQDLALPGRVERREEARAGSGPVALAARRPFDSAFLGTAALCAWFYAWFLSSSWPLTDRVGAREHYYSVAAVALLHGQLWVPPQTLQFECFMVKGRCFGYFGLAPTLLRLPVAWILGAGMETDAVERVFFLLGFAVLALGAWWVCRQILGLWAPPASRRARWVVGAVAAVSGLGASPLVFLVSRPMVYEEAILWGVAFALVALGAAISFRLRPRLGVLVVLVAADGLAVLSRPTVGASALFATLVLGVWCLRQRRGFFAGCLILGALLAGSSASVVAYAKFGSLSPPYQDQILISQDPVRVASFRHPLGVNLKVLPTKLVSTLRPDSLRFFDHPPFVALGEAVPTVVWPAKITDLTWETTSSVTATLPLSTLLSLIGLLALGSAAVRRWRARPWRDGVGDDRTGITLLVVLSAGGALVFGLTFPGETVRYLNDWLPLSFVASAVGLAWLAEHWPRRRGQAGIVAALLAVLLCGQATVQAAAAVRNGLTSAYWYPASCARPADPYGLLGPVFCPSGLSPP